MDNELIALAFGGGTDSTGILCGWAERGLQAERPITIILFADTGSERPHTYEHIERMQQWLPRHGFPRITVVKKGGRQETLEENCLRMNMLPSLAYGFKGCSHKFKIEPQEKYMNNHPDCKAWWARGQRITKLIGYEFRETKRWQRAKKYDDKYEYEFPLVEWEWSREDCQRAITRMGLPLPGKSSCFFCPASTTREIDQLKREYPVLFHRALALEDNALQNLDTVKGLGRRFNWRQYAEGRQAVAEEMRPCEVCIDN